MKYEVWQMNSKNDDQQHRKLRIKLGVCILAAVTGAMLILSACGAAAQSTPSSSAPPASSAVIGAGITINKDEITTTAKFIPYQAGDTKMEIIAVKAPDGTIRTAFNTCQVCFDSGRGYYVQEGDQLVCQNCGNKFNISAIEKEKNGCNPAPILDSDKQDDGKTITISADYLDQNKELFSNWKTK
jgi:uncharacterized membrane protein